MAEFGADAASLGPAQAQLSPVAPVQEQATDNPLTSLVRGAGELLSKGLEEKVKDDELQKKNAVLTQVSSAEATLNDAMSQGTISATEAASRSRANYNKFIASYPQYASDINSLNTAFKATTETGERDDQLADARSIRNAQLTQASQQGFYIPPGSTPAQQDAIIQASQSGVRIQKAFEQQVREHDEARASGRYSTEVINADQKRLATQSVTNAFGDAYTGFTSTIDGITQGVRNGNIDMATGQAQINAYRGRIGATITALAGQNPDLAKPYMDLLNQTAELGIKLSDPKQRTEELQNQYNGMILKGKINAVSGDPSIMSAAVASSLFPSSTMLAVPQASAVMKVLYPNGAVSTSNGVASGFQPQIVGDPNVEAGALRVLKEGLGNLNTGKVTNPIGASVEATNTVNAVLKQVGNQLNDGSLQKDPTKLKGVASFFASPEYTAWVKQGHVDQASQAAAKHTFQALYEPAVIDAIGTTLKSNLNEAGTGASVGASVEAKWSGSGVTFSPLGRPKDAQEAQEQQRAVASLNNAQQGLNTIIRIGANLNGGEDPQKYWEENKHIYLPQVYPDPAKLKEGQVVNGKKYMGGNYTNPNNWQVVTTNEEGK